MRNNIMTKYDGWATSYLPDQSSSILDFESASQDETALIIDDLDLYFILNGDWREKYAECSTLNEAVALFTKNYKEHRSSYSDHPNEINLGENI